MSTPARAPSSPSSSSAGPSTTPPAWWTFGHVWLVLAGPLLVVVASFITMYIAYTQVDPVVDANYYQKGMALAPAIQSRDHTDSALAPASITTHAVKP